MNRQEKEAMVDELHEKLERSKATILTDYRGLKVTEITELRYKLKEAGIAFQPVGDCNGPRKIIDAIHEGYLAAAKL